MESCLYRTTVTHQRFAPKAHYLSYQLTYFLFDLDELDHLDQDNRLFARNRWGIFSLHDRDYGDRSGRALRPQVERELRHAGIDDEIGAIKLLTLPRLFGYAFNPLSVYYCYDQRGRLTSLLYEVTNTFKDRHTYVIPCAMDDIGIQRNDDHIRQDCQKRMYVSPFADLDLGYEFVLKDPGERLNLVIHQTKNDDRLLTAAMSGRQLPITAKTLLQTCLRFPMQTFKVVAGIHWEALKLWLKGLSVFAHVAPDGPTSSIGRSR